FHFGGHGDVFNDESSYLEAVFFLKRGIDQRKQRFAKLAVAGLDVQRRNFARRERLAENADDPRAHRVGELLQPKVIVRAGDFFQETRHVDDLEVVRTKRAQPDDAEVLIPDHNRIRCAPVVTREQPGGYVINVGLEWRVEAVLP